jgi:hypothetical protein
MNVLLIWHSNDQEPQGYLIEEATEEEIDVLKKASNEVMGICGLSEDKDDALCKVMDALLDNKEYASNKDWACRWVNKKVKFPLKTKKNKIDIIVMSGYVA